MRNSQHPGRVEDYTDAFLGTVAVILFMGFWVMSAVFGFIWVILTTALIDIVIKRFIRPR